MIPDEVARAVIDAAKRNDIDACALLALVEVETSGKTFEADGRTPAFLYERHVTRREAARIGDIDPLGCHLAFATGRS